jgi:hypothetical protein
MSTGEIETSAGQIGSIAQWQAMLRDEGALINQPGARHKVLLTQAHELHRAQVINGDELSDMLEQADGALAYAVEALFDRDCGE